MEKNRFFGRIDQFLIRLSTREKWMLGGGGFIASFLIIFFFLVDPTLERMKQLDSLIPRKERDLSELIRLKQSFQGVSKEIDAVVLALPEESSFSALSFLEEHAAKNRIKGNIAFIRPLAAQEHLSRYREVPVEVKVEKVRLSEIIPFLAALENSKNRLRIKRLSMKTRFSNPDLMDVTFLVLSYEKVAS